MYLYNLYRRHYTAKAGINMLPADLTNISNSSHMVN